MLAQLTERSYREWTEYYNAEPWGEERADLRAAITSYVVYHSAPGKRQRRRVEDFMAVRADTRERRLHAFHAALMRSGTARRVTP